MHSFSARHYIAANGPEAPKHRRPHPAAESGLDYRVWRARRLATSDDLYRQQAAALRLPYAPLLSIVTPLYETPPDRLRRLVDSVRLQTYTGWEHCLVDDGSTEAWIAGRMDRLATQDSRVKFRRRPENGGIVAASNEALSMASGEFVVFLDHDDVLEPDALYRVVQALNERPESDVLYSDLDLIDSRGAPAHPFLLPEWSPELLLSLPYIVHLTAYRRSLVEAMGGLRAGLDGAQDYDLALRATERTDRIIHLPRVLYHWCMAPTSAANNLAAKPYGDRARIRAVSEHLARRGLPAEVRPLPVAPGYHSVRFAVADSTVSIIVRDAGCGIDVDRLRRRLDGGLAVDVHVVPATPDAASDCNAAASSARGHYLLFIDSELGPESEDWLAAMAEYVQQDGIGAVGAKILNADDTIAHAGVVIPQHVPREVLRGAPGHSTGHLCNLVIPTNYSAVAGNCLMTRRAAFNDVGGFRPASRVGFPDIDYCLRLRERGYRIVFTPHALLRRESSEPPAVLADQIDRLRVFQAEWRDRLPAVDPYYNPNFAQETAAFTLG